MNDDGDGAPRLACISKSASLHARVASSSPNAARSASSAATWSARSLARSSLSQPNVRAAALSACHTLRSVTTEPAPTRRGYQPAASEPAPMATPAPTTTSAIINLLSEERARRALEKEHRKSPNPRMRLPHLPLDSPVMAASACPASRNSRKRNQAVAKLPVPRGIDRSSSLS